MFLSSATDYREWRAAKLDRYPTRVDELIVNIGELADLDYRGTEAIRSSCRRANMAIYSCNDSGVDHTAILAFAANFGLRRIDHHLCASNDGVAELTVASEGAGSDYVPYSDHSLGWHTDGYYNAESSRVRAVILHCVQDATTGGETGALDPEIVYIRLRDANPAFITALEHPECMTIPANVGNRGEIRPAICGPVFSYDAADGALHMRYSARKKNICWRD
ncbi:MAG: TauD/TfdA family dioxygenase, partial [Gammaproteobacteria bacterium]|nr:TauD/TfdA family dioxygenase [Gammaproteobacteria bacterium]